MTEPSSEYEFGDVSKWIRARSRERSPNGQLSKTARALAVVALIGVDLPVIVMATTGRLVKSTVEYTINNIDAAADARRLEQDRAASELGPAATQQALPAQPRARR